MKKITPEDILDAMERNGYRKANGTFIQIKKEFKGEYTEGELRDLAGGLMLPKSPDHVYAACAMGQAGLNLGVPPARLDLNHYETDVSSSTVFHMNDSKGLPVKTIAKKLKKRIKLFREYKASKLTPYEYSYQRNRV
jgi:hypothetical protein